MFLIVQYKGTACLSSTLYKLN